MHLASIRDGGFVPRVIPALIESPLSGQEDEAVVEEEEDEEGRG